MSNSASVEIPLRRFQDALWAVDIEIQGQEHVFLFDTGAGVTLLTPELVESLGLRPSGRITAHRQSGERMDLCRCPVSPMRVGGEILEPREMAILDLCALLPPAWPRPGGALALDAFEGRALTLDFTGRRVILESEASLEARASEMDPVPVRISRPAAGAALDVFLGAATADGLVWLELDSGNSGPALLAPHAAATLGIDLAAPLVSHEPATEGRPERWLVPQSDLLLGNHATCTPFVVQELIIDGNLGSEFLATHGVTLDLAPTPRCWIASQ